MSAAEEITIEEAVLTLAQLIPLVGISYLLDVRGQRKQAEAASSSSSDGDAGGEANDEAALPAAAALSSPRAPSARHKSNRALPALCTACALRCVVSDAYCKLHMRKSKVKVCSVAWSTRCAAKQCCAELRLAHPCCVLRLGSALGLCMPVILRRLGGALPLHKPHFPACGAGGTVPSKNGTIHENEESVVSLPPPDGASEASDSNYALVVNPSALGYQSSSKRSAASVSELDDAQQPAQDPLATPKTGLQSRSRAASFEHNGHALAESLRDQWRLRESTRVDTPRAIRHAARSALAGGVTFASLSMRVRAHGAAAYVRWARTEVVATEEEQEAVAFIVVQRCGSSPLLAGLVARRMPALCTAHSPWRCCGSRCGVPAAGNSCSTCVHSAPAQP